MGSFRALTPGSEIGASVVKEPRGKESFREQRQEQNLLNQ
jgi:hypothetical protein